METQLFFSLQETKVGIVVAVGRVFTSPLVVFQLLSGDLGHNVDWLAVYLACVREQLYNGDLLRCSMMLMSSRQFFLVFFSVGERKSGRRE